eukprot:SAG31_NODE_18297_length_641_cov_0.859779_2_plen_68_part_01
MISAYDAVQSGGSFIWDRRTASSGSWRVRKLNEKDLERAERMAIKLRSESMRTREAELASVSFRTVSL